MDHANSEWMKRVLAYIGPTRFIVFSLLKALTVFAALTSAFFVSLQYSGKLSDRLANDYALIEVTQRDMLDGMIGLQNSLLEQEQVNLPARLEDLRRQAEVTLLALGGLESPTNRITAARREYRSALERFIGVTNRLEREKLENSALMLHNAMQSVANTAGKLANAIEDFNGGLWPRALGALF